MKSFSNSSKIDSGFNRSAWLTLAVATSLLVLSIAQIIYRFTLSTDGWSVYTEEIENADWIYDSNLVGAPSALQAGDRLLSVGERSVEGTASVGYLPPPEDWQSGRSVVMTLTRSDQQVVEQVPIVHWTWRAIWRYNTRELSQLASTAGALLFLAIGWYTFLRRPAVPSARALLMISTAFGAAYISGLLPDGLSVQFDQLAFVATGFFSYVIFGTLLAPSLLTFSLLFPHPKQVIQRNPWLAFLPYAIGLILLIFLVTGGSGVVGWITAMIMLVASLASLVHAGLTQRDAVSRAQLRWAISGFVLGVGLFMLNYPVAFGWVNDLILINLLSSIASMGIAVIGIGFSVAVLRYRLFDIDVIIRRTLVYTTLTAMLALVYFGSVVLLQTLFEGLTGQESPIAIVISTLGIAALFTPLRRRVQDIIDRRFYRGRYNAEQVLAQFASAARDEVDIDQLTHTLLSIVEETVQPKGLGLWLRPPSNGRQQTVQESKFEEFLQ